MTSYGQRSGTAKEQQEKQGLGYPQSQEHPVEAALHLTLQRSARGQVPGASLTEVKHPKLLVGRKEHIPHFKIKFKKKKNPGQRQRFLPRANPGNRNVATVGREQPREKKR